MFFKCIEKLNRGHSLSLEMQASIIAHFEFTWKNDKNFAFDDAGMNMLEQLPPTTINSIFNTFLHKGFLKRYHKMLLFPKDFRVLGNSSGKMFVSRFFSWEDQAYREFMLTMLKSLETRFVPCKTVLLNEFDESQEVNFLMKGSIVIGYEMNRLKKYCLLMKGACIIGAYECTFGVRSEFIFSTLKYCEFLYIRKVKWDELLLNNRDVAKVLLGKTLFDYKTNIKCKVLRMKNRLCEQLKKRADYHLIQVNQLKEDADMLM